MRLLLQKIFSLFLIFLLTFSPVLAKNNIKIPANITHDFSLNDMPQEVFIKTNEDQTLPDGTVIPAGAVVTFDIIQAQEEKRWHKAGFILCKLKNYTAENNPAVADLSDKNIYLVIRKHENINKKEATILSTEIILTQAASIVGSCFIFFAPVDIVYFFTKGVITSYHDTGNWFKSGVSCAYDNSIFWFWLKGKPIELAKNDEVMAKDITEKKALKLKSKIDKRNLKKEIKAEKKLLKAEIKQAKADEKQQRRLQRKQKKQIEETVTEGAA